MSMTEGFCCCFIFYIMTIVSFIFASHKIVDSAMPALTVKQKERFHSAPFAILEIVMVAVCTLVLLQVIFSKEIIELKNFLFIFLILGFHFLHFCLGIIFEWRKIIFFFKEKIGTTVFYIFFSAILSFMTSNIVASTIINMNIL